MNELNEAQAVGEKAFSACTDFDVCVVLRIQISPKPYTTAVSYVEAKLDRIVAVVSRTYGQLNKLRLETHLSGKSCRFREIIQSRQHFRLVALPTHLKKLIERCCIQSKQ